MEAKRANLYFYFEKIFLSTPVQTKPLIQHVSHFFTQFKFIADFINLK
jgi:hypothetical protein